MSRPTALQRAQADAAHTKALTTYAEITMVAEALSGVITREYNRFGATSPIGDELARVGILLGYVRQDAEARVREATR